MNTRTPLPVPDTDLPALESLEHLERRALLALYQRLLGYPAPTKTSRQFLIGNCAWAIQARQRGWEPMALRRELIAALEARFGRDTGNPVVRYKPGTRLIREWAGEVHEVIILDKGFRWRDHTFTSLSAIATAITGTRWSGPRFFGIDTQPKLNGRRRERLERQGRKPGSQI